MNMSEALIEEANLSQAWATALRRIVDSPRKEMSPLVISLIDYEESNSIRSLLNKNLNDRKMDSIDTVAGTIFPAGIAALSKDRFELYREYLEVIPRIRKVDSRNRRGTYFERLIAFDGSDNEKVNQIEIIINSLQAGTIKRRSKLQASVFDPRVDHTDGPYQSFPCLQHVTFYKSENGGLVLNSFYAIQYLFQRAYGNWLGLINLGKFVANETGLRLERFNCFVSIEQLDHLTKAEAKKFLKSIE